MEHRHSLLIRRPVTLPPPGRGGCLVTQSRPYGTTYLEMSAKSTVAMLTDMSRCQFLRDFFESNPEDQDGTYPSLAERTERCYSDRTSGKEKWLLLIWKSFQALMAKQCELCGRLCALTSLVSHHL